MHDIVRVGIVVDAPVEKVWKALTDKEQLKEWYFDIPDFGTEVGTNFSFYEPGEKKQYHHFCEIMDVIPGEKLKYSWEYPELSKSKSIVKWQLSEKDGGTYLTLKHKGLENFHHLGNDFQHDSFEKGWNEIVTKNLKEFLEK